MITRAYTEDQLVEQPAIALFVELGWQTVSAMEEVFGPGGTRFFKTRSLVAKAVDGGKVTLNGERVKPAKELKPGDDLAIHVAELQWTVNVKELSERRGPAEAARQLYSETEASQQHRQQVIEARRIRVGPLRDERGRPTKRDRRLIRRFTERD